jgi:hypothetical protein
MWPFLKYLLPFLAAGCATSSYKTPDPATDQLIEDSLTAAAVVLLALWVVLARRANQLSFHFVVVIVFVTVCVWARAGAPHKSLATTSLIGLALLLVIDQFGRASAAVGAFMAVQFGCRLLGCFLVIAAIFNAGIGGILPSSDPSLLASITRRVGLLVMAGILLWVGGWVPGSPGHALRRPASDDDREPPPAPSA